MYNKRNLLKIISLITVPLLISLFLLINEIFIEKLVTNKLNLYKEKLFTNKQKELIKNVDFIHKTISINFESNFFHSNSKEKVQYYKNELLKYIKSMANNKNDYYWVTDSNLNIIMHPIYKEYEFKELKDVASNFDNNLLQANLKEKGKSTFTYTLINDNNQIDKIATIILFKPWNWGIAKSFKISDIYNELSILEENLIKDYKSILQIVFIVFILFTIMLIYIIQKLSSKSIIDPMQNDINKLNTKLIEKNNELKHKLYFDELTDLKNLASLENDISKVETTCLFLIDIDSFDNINKLYGYTTGDKILIEYSKLLHKFAKENSYTAYRLYSNTFALQGQKEAFKFDEFNKDILELIENHTNIAIKEDNELNIHLDINMGLCLYQDNAIIKANTALQEAKKHTNRFYIYNGEIDEKYKIEKYLDIKRILENAITSNMIVPYFHAIVNENKKIVKYESLMRINQNGNILAPVNFMDIAIKTKLYSKISIIMIEKSILQAKKYKKDISINLSISDFFNRDFFEMLDKYLNEKNLELCELITLEILEDHNIDNIDIINSLLLKYRKFGVKIAIDDFGAGYSNFINILKIKPDYIKIDGSLIKNIDKDNDSFELVKSIVNFANTLNICIIAEFIHNEEVFNVCKELGINRFQGFYFYKPRETFIGLK